MAFRLDGRVAIVTAGAHGIGAASARIMAQQGATVVIGDINEPLALETAEAIRAAGGHASAMAMDARDEKSVRELITRTHAAHGRLDILHNNAGGAHVGQDTAPVDLPQDIWDDTFAWNLSSVRWGCQQAIPLMIAGGGGAIINTVSAAAFFAQSTMAAYGSAKAAVASYTRYIAVYYGQQNIRCNGIAPGLIVRPNAEKKMPPAIRDAIYKHATTPRMGIPDDIGNLAAYLASDEAAYINGQVITVDGGVGIRFSHDAEMVQIMAANR